MIMGDLSIFLTHFQYFFFYHSLSLAWLELSKIYYIFEAIMKGVVFLISLSVHLYFVYTKAIAFCNLVSYPASLLNVFVSCRLFLVKFTVTYVYHLIF